MVRRHGNDWRQPHTPPRPERCDHQSCCFHTKPLVWPGEPLKPIVEHHPGIHAHHRPTPLPRLGPHGDALHHETRGGAHTGRMEKASGGVAKVDRGGTRHDVRPAEPGRDERSPEGQAAQLVIAADAQERRR